MLSVLHRQYHTKEDEFCKRRSEEGGGIVENISMLFELCAYQRRCDIKMNLVSLILHKN